MRDREVTLRMIANIIQHPQGRRPHVLLPGEQRLQVRFPWWQRQLLGDAGHQSRTEILLDQCERELDPGSAIAVASSRWQL